MMGSCFTENIGSLLHALKLPVLINPFGILFNPESIAQSIELLMNDYRFSHPDLVSDRGMWHSFSHHGSFSNSNADQCVDNINQNLDRAKQWFAQSRFIIITFGTAWVYRYNATKKIVSNCHKIDARQFTREKLNVDDIVNRYETILHQLHTLYPNQEFIFTVSPVRHLRDGEVENQVSKSTLILAIDALKNKFPFVHYFPSYEIMMDDLRDYRFYAEDMVHPSQVAIRYIFDLFKSAWIESATQKTMDEIEKVVQTSKHRPLNAESDEFKRFAVQQLLQLEKLSVKHPTLNFDGEIDYFRKFID
jgi:lysophospholipase L1-like esterase